MLNIPLQIYKIYSLVKIYDIFLKNDLENVFRKVSIAKINANENTEHEANREHFFVLSSITANTVYAIVLY